MIGVRSLAYDAATGALTVAFDDQAGSRIVVHGWLGARPQTPEAGEMIRWDLLLRARPDHDLGDTWATLSVEPPPDRPEWMPT